MITLQDYRFAPVCSLFFQSPGDRSARCTGEYDCHRALDCRHPAVFRANFDSEKSCLLVNDCHRTRGHPADGAAGRCFATTRSWCCHSYRHAGDCRRCICRWNVARSRIALLAVLAFVGISSQMVPMGPLFALLTLPICLAAVAGLAIVRYESSRRRRPSLSKQATSSAICP